MQNIIKMIQFDLEVQINDTLTLFLHNFKSIFAAKMSLVESICLNTSSLQTNPQFLLSKLSTKIFKFQWAIDPYTIPIAQDILSNIQRFYLRIQQYLEYRLNSLANLQDKAFNKEIEIFHKCLHKLISSLQSQLGLSGTVGDFLFQLSWCEKMFIARIIELISNKSISLMRGPLDYESLSDIRSFIDSKICKQQFQMFKERPKISLPVSREKKFSLRARQEQPSKLKFLMKKKISSKVQAVRQSLPPRNLRNCLVDNSLQQNNWESKIVIPEDESIQLQNYVEKQNQIKFNKAYDILDIQTSRTPLTKQNIFADLQGKNIKNKTLIQKFVHKYQKKQRRSLRRQNSEKQSKSSVKSSKIPHKSQERNIISMRKQNSQHIPSLKFAHQNIKKYQQFQLPLILSRNNRRTTVQK